MQYMCVVLHSFWQRRTHILTADYTIHDDLPRRPSLPARKEPLFTRDPFGALTVRLKHKPGDLPGLAVFVYRDHSHIRAVDQLARPRERFHIGFTTDYGYNELRVMSYLPNGWNKLAIPLRFYRSLPDARVDLAATFNQPRYTGWVNLGGRRGELHGVDSIGIRMRAPIGNPEFELRSITLSVEDPGDQYLGEIPVLDEFGQHNLVDYPAKINKAEGQY